MCWWWVPGPVARYYNWGAEWSQQLGQSGGGSTLNLSIHFFDLIHELAPNADWKVTGASMSSSLSGSEVEDYSISLVEGKDGVRAVIETGYFFPVGTSGENVMVVVKGGDYYRWDASTQQVVVTFEDGREPQTFDVGRGTQSAYYPAFVNDVIRRVRNGEPPEAGLPEVLRAVRMVESAYRHAGYVDSMV